MPVSGKMMGVLNGSATEGGLLVSFDLSGEIAFHGPIAGTIGESSLPFYAGTFLPSGTFVVHGTNGVSTIEDAGSLPAFSAPEEASAEVGTNILNSGWDNIGDITTMFDSSGQEIVIGYANNIQSFIAAPIASRHECALMSSAATK